MIFLIIWYPVYGSPTRRYLSLTIILSMNIKFKKKTGTAARHCSLLSKRQPQLWCRLLNIHYRRRSVQNFPHKKWVFPHFRIITVTAFELCRKSTGLLRIHREVRRGSGKNANDLKIGSAKWRRETWAIISLQNPPNCWAAAQIMCLPFPMSSTFRGSFQKKSPTL